MSNKAQKITNIIECELCYKTVPQNIEKRRSHTHFFVICEKQPRILNMQK